MKRDYEACRVIAENFQTKRDFRKRASGEFQWLQRNGLLEAACAHMDQLRRSLSDADIAEIAGRYDTRRAFKLGDQSAYQAARKRGTLDVVCDHMDKGRYRVLTNEQIAEIAARYSTRSELARRDNGAYQTATKRGILDAVCAHMDGKGDRRLADAEILEIAGRFSTRNDFKLGDFGAYTTAIRRGLIDSACAHMNYGATGFREDKPAVLYQFRIETADGRVVYKVGITNRKPSQRAATMRIFRGAKVELTKCIHFDLGRDARIAEKRLLRRFAGCRYEGPPVMRNGSTELFTTNPLEI